MFCCNVSKEAVAQSVSVLCLVNLLKTMVVGSSPDDDELVFVFIFFPLPSTASLAEIVIFSAKRTLFFFPPQKRLVVDVPVKVHNVLHNCHNRSGARFKFWHSTSNRQLAYSLIKVQISE